MMESESETFEYDEDMEAGDEAMEGDEGLEASDEDVEAEAVDEGDEASDEVYEASDEADEADEALDEALDEADEAFGEATVSASARLRASQDRNRRSQWARRVAADQRLEAQRAASTQRSITNQIKSIQPGGQTKVYSVGQLQGAGVVTAVLPNGRRSRMRIMPTLAPISEVNRLRAVISVNDKRQAIATGRNSKAITALVTTQANAVKKLTAEQVKSDRDLRKRIVEGDNRLDKRITKELSGGTGSLDKHGRRMASLLRRNRQRSVMNSVLLATAAPFFAAYGDRARPFSKNNLILTGSLLGWLLGDELVDQFSGKKPGALKSGANLWSYLAPIGNGATAYFLLDKKQHTPFVAGISTVTGGTALAIDLTTTQIRKNSIDDFRRATPTVVASVVAGTPGDVTATVANGILTLNCTADATVAWIVDTSTI